MGTAASARARGVALAIVASVLLVAPSSAARAYHMEDSLRGSTTGTALGGSFSADGWTVGSKTDRIWWAIPRLAAGSIEFTVTAISPANLLVNDNEIFSMYEAGYGIEEPIVYGPDFRNNHYKMLVRIYGQAEADRVGAIKLMWGMCPSGDPGYWVDETMTCGCGSFFEEPFAEPPAWDGSARRVRIEWEDGRTRLLIDGAEILSIDWSESGLTYGPSDVHMMLGSARNDAVDASSMPIGAVFSDLVVDGVEGPLASCPGTDAGVPQIDAAVVDVDAGAEPEPDSGAQLDAAIDASGSRDGGRRTTVEPGCGCRVTARRGPPWVALGLLALALRASRAARAQGRSGASSDGRRNTRAALRQ